MPEVRLLCLGQSVNGFHGRLGLCLAYALAVRVCRLERHLVQRIHARRNAGLLGNCRLGLPAGQLVVVRHMLLVAVEHGAQFLLACVLEVAVELAVLNRILVLGDMERIAGSTVAVSAEKRILLRVRQTAVTVKDCLHSLTLAHA